MNLIVLDTETSDLDPARGATILEIAWNILTPTEHGWEKIDSFESYIHYLGPISPHAQAVHHIRSDQLMDGIPRDKAIQILLENVQPDTYFIAHNVEFDSKFLPEIRNPWICTLRAARQIWPNAPGHSNQVLRYWLGIQFDLPGRFPHQAIYDVGTTTGILLKMLETHSPEELYKLSNSPVKLRRLRFGKYRDIDLQQVPRDYLMWLSNQSNLDPDVRYTIDSILNA